MGSRQSVRSFATAATNESHKPLINLYGLQARYANATYIAASKVNSLEKVEEELVALKNTAETSKPFSDFLQNPLVSRTEKSQKLVELLDGKTTPITLNLLLTLAGNARLNVLEKVVDAYVKMMKAKRNEVEATVISSHELTKAQMIDITTAMKSQVPAGSKVVLQTKVDPAILGGLQVQIGDQFLDLSVKNRIDSIHRMVV